MSNVMSSKSKDNETNKSFKRLNDLKSDDFTLLNNGNEVDKYNLNDNVNENNTIDEVNDKSKDIVLNDDKKALNKTITYTIDSIELKKIEIEKNVFFRLLDKNGKRYIDIRKFYKGYPTKKGVELTLELFNIVKDLIK